MSKTTDKIEIPFLSDIDIGDMVKELAIISELFYVIDGTVMPIVLPATIGSGMRKTLSVAGAVATHHIFLKKMI